MIEREEMMKRSFAKLTAAVSAAGALVACAGAQPATPPPPVAVEIDRLFPTIENMGAVSVTAKVVITNPRDAAATLTGIEYTVTPEGDLAPASSRLDAEQSIEPGQTISTEVAASVPLPVGEAGYLDLIRANTMPVTLTGVARFSDGTTSEFTKNGAIAFPNIPELIVYESQAARYGEQGVDVTFYLRLVNENPFGVVVDTATYAVLLDGKLVREATAGIGIRLPQGSVQEYEVNTSIDQATFGDDFQKYADMDAFSYEVRGEVVVQGMKMPFVHEGTIELQ